MGMAHVAGFKADCSKECRALDVNGAGIKAAGQVAIAAAQHAQKNGDGSGSLEKYQRNNKWLQQQQQQYPRVEDRLRRKGKK